ncbi:hypothetical protein [Micromonospora eburnea]|uniref:hypothetical protein n=1 Tax=Micromonospora eburnea TaxID=227316 RepID=UPI000B804444|nr:hypothetical protein [Micromonospora eburnea]
MTGPAARPYVPSGTLLRLAAADWTPECGDLTPGTDIAVVVSALGGDPTDGGWTCVVGHRPQCAYPADEHPPCVELRVRTQALHRYGSPS